MIWRRSHSLKLNPGHLTSELTLNSVTTLGPCSKTGIGIHQGSLSGFIDTSGPKYKHAEFQELVINQSPLLRGRKGTVFSI